MKTYFTEDAMDRRGLEVGTRIQMTFDCTRVSAPGLEVIVAEVTELKPITFEWKTVEVVQLPKGKRHSIEGGWCRYDRLDEPSPYIKYEVI